MRSGYVKNLILFIVKSLGTNQPLEKVEPKRLKLIDFAHLLEFELVDED